MPDGPVGKVPLLEEGDLHGDVILYSFYAFDAGKGLLAAGSFLVGDVACGRSPSAASGLCECAPLLNPCFSA